MAPAEPEPDFVITRLFRAPRPRVWDAWFQAGAAGAVVRPEGCLRTTVLRHELQPGGLLHARMDRPDGGTMWARFVYRAVEPPARLVWAHAFGDAAGNAVPSPFGGPAAQLELLTTVTFEAADEATRVTLRWSPIDATAEERAAFAAAMPSMEGGWGGSFEQLDQFLG